MKKILVVGAGFSGATIARELADNGYFVDVIDKRNHIGGNCYDYTNEFGIRVHKYGPHLFHTSNYEVVQWLSRFTEWTPYYHKVKAQLKDGSYVPLPINLETLSYVKEDSVVDVFIRPYTKKMWCLDLDEIDPQILSRIPIRKDYKDLYFPNDIYQMLPLDGYTSLFDAILKHPNISVSLSTEFNKCDEASYFHIFNSMAIDEYFDYCLGELPYRSIRFHSVTLPSPKILPTAVVNFTHSAPFTRITEWKNLPNHGENECFTTLTYEEPCDYRQNNLERYYPVKDIKGINRNLYMQYSKLSASNTTFIGRCGQYVYIDMHQAVASALTISKKFLERNIRGFMKH